MADPAPTTPLTGDNKDTLFGPNIGIVGAGPEWASDPSEKKSAKKDSEKVDEDELTPEIVKEWMKRSSDVRSFVNCVQSCHGDVCGSRLNRRQRCKHS